MTVYVCNYKNGESDFNRPWGGWETTAVGHLGEDEGGLAFCDKILTVNPGCELSIQKHIGRQEVWVITEGRAIVHLGDGPEIMKEFPLEAGEQIFIPAGKWHRIENRSDKVMKFAERQSGIYLDEQDNIRFPTTKDPRTTNEAAMLEIRAEIARLNLDWPHMNRRPPSGPKSTHAAVLMMTVLYMASQHVLALI